MIGPGCISIKISAKLIVSGDCLIKIQKSKVGCGKWATTAKAKKPFLSLKVSVDASLIPKNNPNVSLLYLHDASFGCVMVNF